MLAILLNGGKNTIRGRIFSAIGKISRHNRERHAEAAEVQHEAQANIEVNHAVQRVFRQFHMFLVDMSFPWNDAVDRIKKLEGIKGDIPDTDTLYLAILKKQQERLGIRGAVKERLKNV